jgi:cytochrome c-type biogenesis protein CcmH/NrfG
MRLSLIILAGFCLCLFVFPSTCLCQSVVDHYQAGTEYHKAGNLDSALAAFERVLQTDPGNADACVAMGDIHLQAHRYSEARQAYQRALQIDAWSAEAHLGVGNVFWYGRQVEGRIDSALAAYRKALELEPSNAKGNYYTGKALSVKQEHEEAILLLERAIELDPGAPDPHASLGISYLATRQYEKAHSQWLELNRNMLIGLPKNSVLFTNGDKDTFPIWYLQKVEGLREDVRIINLRLLNTPWYIRFLRDVEPRIDIRYEDEFLDQELSPQEWAAQDTVEVVGLTWLLRPASEDTLLLRIQDVMLVRIIDWNEWRRPIYFAITTAKENRMALEDYLVLEGLAYRLSRQKGTSVDLDKALENFQRVYSYDHIRDQGIPADVERILENYCSAIYALAYALHKENQHNRSLQTLEWADRTGLFRDTRDYKRAAALARVMEMEELAGKFEAKARALE